MNTTNQTQVCRTEAEEQERHYARLPAVVERLAASCGRAGCYDHINPTPLPSPEAVVALIAQARRILFPGYFTSSRMDAATLGYYLGQEATALYGDLAAQVSLAIQHDCYRYERTCSQCSQAGHDIAFALIESLPEIRRRLSLDVDAALAGDPATSSADEVIFSYPGLMAVTIHRLAHRLYELGAPILPRMMSEHAHRLTGIDIHPGARIGESFFIDHGTGVVIGQTCEIGDRVRLYQGVTLGALSLPADAGQRLKGSKRHPTIEDEVIIYAGATILGGQTVIGARSIIGGNTWITSSVPPDTKVLLKEPALIYIGKNAGPPPEKKGKAHARHLS